MIRAMMMIDDFTVRHVEHVSTRPFEQVTAAFEAATGDISDGRFARELALSGDAQEFERRIRGYEADSGFMRFLTLDHGAWASLYGEAVKARLYTVGNPLIARTMMKHDIGVGLNVPVRVLIYESPSGEARFAYDLPSSLMGRRKDAGVTAAARELDTKLAALAERVTAAKAQAAQA